MTMFAVVVGDPIDGFTLHGPYNSDAAERYAEAEERAGETSWIAPLHGATFAGSTVEAALSAPEVTHLLDEVDQLIDSETSPEYRRAVTELVARFAGLTDDHWPAVAARIGWTP